MPSYYWEESMHSTKARLLGSIIESSAAVDRGFGRNLRVITDPAAHSCTRLGGAFVTLPLLAVSAVLGDLSYIMISRSSDEGWQHLRPPDSP